MTPTQFRTDFPMFASTTDYPEAMVQFYINLADKMLLECRWGTMKPYGIELFVAHNLVLYKKDMDAAAVGGTPGGSTGNTNSKTVGAASVSYDTNSTLETGAGHWNLTTYGKQFIRLARMMGAGAVQL